MSAPAIAGLELAFGLSAAAFAGSAGLDLWEHLRLERRETGRLLRAEAVPLGETGLHLGLAALFAAVLALARPVPPVPEVRDWVVLGSPLGFLVLGWADECLYHRRRCERYEHLLHTTSHIAAGASLSLWLVLALGRGAAG